MWYLPTCLFFLSEINEVFTLFVFTSKRSDHGGLLRSPGSHSVIGESIACKHSTRFIVNTVNYVKYWTGFKIAGWLCWWPVHFDVSCTSSFTHLHLADKPQHMPEQRFPKAFLSSWPLNPPSITFHINELMKSFLAIKKEKEKANKITPRNEFSCRKQEMIIFTQVIPKL